jgi:hypothetical protein
MLPELSVDTIKRILTLELDDETVNGLVLQTLGFSYDPSTGEWKDSQADPAWKSGSIPDVIAHRADSVKLTRSIRQQHKQLLKEYLHFPGYKIAELTPQKTRRATAANWLLSVLLERGLVADSTHL